jgi:sugar phosphate isomerase/epimerase
MLSRAETFDYPWKLGVITDEVDSNLSRVLTEFYPKYGLKWAEFRNVSLDGRAAYVYQDATPVQLHSLRKQLDDAGVKLSVLDTAVYKITLPGTTPAGQNARDLNPGTGEFGRQLEDLKRAADAAHILGTQKVRIFTFKRVANPDEIFQRIVDELGKAVSVAKEHDVILVIENEFDCNVATGTETGRLFGTLPDRTLMHNWDPGNCIEAGENPFPDAWNKLDHSRIAHMHLKDSKGRGWLPIGAGRIDFVGQFRALKQMRYAETLSLETHYRNARKDPYTSSVESMDGLMHVLSQV